MARRAAARRSRAGRAAACSLSRHSPAPLKPEPVGVLSAAEDRELRSTSRGRVFPLRAVQTVLDVRRGNLIGRRLPYSGKESDDDD